MASFGKFNRHEDGSLMKHDGVKLRTPTCVSQYSKTPSVQSRNTCCGLFERYATEYDMNLCRKF
jgi:hypothetical protein